MAVRAGSRRGAGLFRACSQTIDDKYKIAFLSRDVSGGGKLLCPQTVGTLPSGRNLTLGTRREGLLPTPSRPTEDLLNGSLTALKQMILAACCLTVSREHPLKS